MLFLSVVFDVGPVVECCFSQWYLMLVLLLNVVYPLWSYDVGPVVERCVPSVVFDVGPVVERCVPSVVL